MNRKKVGSKTIKFIYSLSAVIIMWLGWIIAYNLIGNEYILPSVTDTLLQLFITLRSAAFWTAFFNTVLRTLISFLLSLVLSSVLAIASYFNGVVRGILSPVMTAVRTLPTMAVILVLLIWTTPKIAPVAVTVLVSFPLLYACFLSALDNIDAGLLEMSRVYGVPLKQKIAKIYVPLSLPYVLSEIGSHLSFSLKVMVSAEVLAKTYQSLGGMMNEAKMYVEIPELLALTVIVILTGCVFELLCKCVNKFAVRWKNDIS